ncbi:MAG: alpha/beta hydrolase [Pseudomonadota bacterium]
MLRRDRLTAAILLVGTLAGWPVPASADETFYPALGHLQTHYDERFPGASFTSEPRAVAGCGDARYLETDALRTPGVGPLVFDHGERRRHSVLLLHGLSDSAWFMCGLAKRLFAAGANVVLTLQTGHGRKEPLPEAHRDDLLAAWQEDGLAGLAFARARGEVATVGGMSMGGVLAVRLWTLQPEAIEGGLMLFSAAFDFSPMLKVAAACSGTAAERSAPWTGWHRWCFEVLADGSRRLERNAEWVGKNPYRNHFSNYGALILGLMRRETLQALETRPFDVPLFIAHSLADTTAPIEGVEALAERHVAPGSVTWMLIDDVRRANCRQLESNCIDPAPQRTACGVPHASVVVEEPILAPDSGAVCEVADPLFDALADATVDFVFTDR